MTQDLIASGIKWIGKVPADWRFRRLKHFASLAGRIGWQGLTSEEYQTEGVHLVTGTDFNKGVVDWASCVRVSEQRWAEAAQVQLSEGDLLITKDGTVGKVAIAENLPGKASLNSGVMVIRPNSEVSQRFLFWVLQSSVFWGWFNDANSGSSTISHLYQGDFYNFGLFFPPSLKEQNDISESLDDKIGIIDQSLETTRRQLDLLDEAKKSLIHEAVTKGLDPSVPMKPSGVEWVGDIPAHWECKRLKHILVSKLQYGATEQGDASLTDSPRYIRITDIDVNHKLKETGIEFLPVASANGYILDDGDLLFARSGATVGKTYLYSSTDGWACFAGYLIRAKVDREQLLPEYLSYFTKSYGYTGWVSQAFSQATIPNIGADKYANLRVPIPSVGEQQEIVDTLDLKCGKLDECIATKKTQLELLLQQRQSVIFEYVTGKRRVGMEKD